MRRCSMAEPLYECPLYSGELLSAGELSDRLRSQAVTLTGKVARLYTRLNLPDAESLAARAHAEHAAHMAYAYLALTGDYPSWRSAEECAPYPVPAWVDTL